MSEEKSQGPEFENNPLWQLHRKHIDRIIDATELEDWRFYDLRKETRGDLLGAIEQQGEFAPDKQVPPIRLDAIDTDAKNSYHESSKSLELKDKQNESL